MSEKLAFVRSRKKKPKKYTFFIQQIRANRQNQIQSFDQLRMARMAGFNDLESDEDYIARVKGKEITASDLTPGMTVLIRLSSCEAANNFRFVIKSVKKKSTTSSANDFVVHLNASASLKGNKSLKYKRERQRSPNIRLPEQHNILYGSINVFNMI